MGEFIKQLIYGADGVPSLTSTMALSAYMFFVIVTLYLVLVGQDWNNYASFAQVTCGGGLVAQVGGKWINNRYAK